METSRELRIQSILKLEIPGSKVFLENESMNHAVPKDSETHFKLLIVSDRFTGLTKVARQRMVYLCLDSEMKSGLHALAIRALTVDEWQRGLGRDFGSPECLGRNKTD